MLAGFPVSSPCSRGGTVQVAAVGGGQVARSGATVRSQAVKWDTCSKLEVAEIFRNKWIV